MVSKTKSWINIEAYYEPNVESCILLLPLFNQRPLMTFLLNEMLFGVVGRTKPRHDIVVMDDFQSYNQMKAKMLGVD
jgi:hypothetical protein